VTSPGLVAYRTQDNNVARNPPREGDRWLKANAVLGSILAIAMLAMALAGL
jgi:hypothetical protein